MDAVSFFMNAHWQYQVAIIASIIFWAFVIQKVAGYFETKKGK